MDRTVRLLVAYDGTSFRGWARQREPAVRTVEGTLGDALAAVGGGPVRWAVAGRTDAGVHARGQVVSFAAGSDVELGAVQRAVNAMVGPEVVVREVRWASVGFDARFSASAREYTYRIDMGAVADPFSARFVWHRPRELAVGQMRAAAKHLVGEHDFTSFCRHPGAGRSTVRRLERLTIARVGDRVDITVRANAFLHQMVRSIVELLVAVGDGRIAASDVPALLTAMQRRATGQLAPPHGLTLERVVYGRRP